MRVKSKNLYWLDYREGDLYASFNSNPSMMYHYYQVPQEVYQSINSANSIGEAFNQLIMKARKPYQFVRNQMTMTGTDENPIFSFPEQAKKPFEEFSDVISYLESKGLARKENDESGEIRVVFSGEYLKEMEDFFKRKNS